MVINALLGLPPSWGAFIVGLNIWKVAPTFEELWAACSQEELRISMVVDPEGVSNAYVSHHKGERSKGPRKKFDMSKIEWYQCHKKGHYKSDCLENPRNKKRGRDQANFLEEGGSKKVKLEESDIRDIHY